jgi:hypothetical protein
VHGDFTRPDDDAPAAQRGQRPSFVGACSARILLAEPCSAMNCTRAPGRSGALGPRSMWSSLVFLGGVAERWQQGPAARRRAESHESPARVENTQAEQVGRVSGTGDSCNRLVRIKLYR